jgi:hypothetical protein
MNANVLCNLNPFKATLLLKIIGAVRFCMLARHIV